MEGRDPKTGRLLPGHKISVGNKGGRPLLSEAERLRSGLRQVVSNGSVKAWAEATRKRFEKGDMVVTEFIFERIAGKVPNLADIPEDSNLADLLERLLNVSDNQAE